MIQVNNEISWNVQSTMKLNTEYRLKLYQKRVIVGQKKEEQWKEMINDTVLKMIDPGNKI